MKRLVCVLLHRHDEHWALGQEPVDYPSFYGLFSYCRRCRVRLR